MRPHNITVRTTAKPLLLELTDKLNLNLNMIT
jgi:hypothetical protein